MSQVWYHHHMEIISFTEKSGTGKSYQAVRLSRQLRADAIIDDGLLIYKGRVVAGKSAKRCKSKAAAMRTALFNYEENRKDVREKLLELDPDRLLILGTSDRMVDWITDALELPRASRRIYIEDVSSEEDREKAAFYRNERGEHVIPAPYMEIRKDFAGYFLDPIRRFRNVSMPNGPAQSVSTVVRPAYSYAGQFQIAPAVLSDIVHITAEDSFHRHLRVIDAYTNRKPEALDVVVVITIFWRDGIMSYVRQFQKVVKEKIEEMTAFSVRNVNVQIRNVVVKREAEMAARRREALKPITRKISEIQGIGPLGDQVDHREKDPSSGAGGRKQ